MSAQEEAVYFRDTIRKLLKFPILYPENYTPTAPNKPVSQKKHPKSITLKALGRSDVLNLSIMNNYMNVGDIRARAVEWCRCTKDDTMRLLLKGKALNDDSVKVINLSEEDPIVINVIVKKQTPLPDAFVNELEVLFNKHCIPEETANRLRNALK